MYPNADKQMGLARIDCVGCREPCQPAIRMPTAVRVGGEPVELRRRTLRNQTPGEELSLDEIPYQVTSLDLDKQQHDDLSEVKDKLNALKACAPPKQSIDWKFVLLLTVAAYASRFYKIWAGAFVL